MQERYVVVVCNLKPVNMRGIKSTAMVLCGSNDDKVEFVEPPKDSKAGDKVFFEGFGDEAPMKQLNPKRRSGNNYNLISLQMTGWKLSLKTKKKRTIL